MAITNQLNNSYLVGVMRGGLIIITLFLYFSTILFSQEKILKQFNQDYGFPSSHVYDGLQDRQGYIWLCTEKGVVKFDGKDSKLFTTEQGLSNNDIWGLFLDSSDRIWLYTFGNKIQYIRNDSVHVLSPNKDFNKIYDIKEDDQNQIWINVLREQYVFRDNKLENFPTATQKTLYQNKKFKYQYITNIDGEYYFKFIKRGTKTSSYTIIKTDEQGNILERYENIIPLRRKAFGLGKSLLINNESGNFEFKSRKLHEIKSLRGDILQDISSFSDFYLVLTVRGHKILNKDFSVKKEFDFLKEMNVNKIFEDRENNIWICTKDEGVFYWNRNQLSTAYLEDFGKNRNLLCLEEDEDGIIWIGGTSPVLYHLDKNKKVNKTILQLDNSSGKTIKKIHPYENKLFVGLNVGLIELNKKEVTSHKKKIISNNYAPNVPIKDLLRRNNSLFASSGDYIFDYPMDNQMVEFKKSSNIKISFYHIENIRDGILVGSHKGLFYYENGIADTLQHSYSRLPITAMEPYKNGEILVATETGKLFKIGSNNKISPLIDIEKPINSIHIQDENSIWLATAQGAFFIENKNNGFYLTLHVNDKSGLISNEVNDICTDEQRIYLATNKGLSVLEKEVTGDRPAPLFLQPIIQEISINQNTRILESGAVLSRNENNPTFHFHSLAFSQLENMNYQYRIPQLDKKWISTPESKAPYTTLPPGDYTFEVKAKVPSFEESGITSFRFSIRPHFTETLWFSLLCLAGLLGVGYGIYMYRMNIIARREKEKNEIKNKFSELELQALQAQMNPHFIFNSLGAIQYFISSGQSGKAEKYLSQFARLLRKFLETSQHKFISLYEELELIKDYIHIEQMRINDQFSFELIVDPKCDLFDIEIPSFLMQPFVENAIIHGLIPKGENAVLKINIEQDKETEKCVIRIDDNGVGRNKINKQPRNVNPKHVSRGLEIVEGRIAVTNRIRNKDISYQIIDKEDHGGTIIKISIPLHKNE